MVRTGNVGHGGVVVAAGGVAVVVGITVDITVAVARVVADGSIETSDARTRLVGGRGGGWIGGWGAGSPIPGV